MWYCMGTYILFNQETKLPKNTKKLYFVSFIFTPIVFANSFLPKWPITCANLLIRSRPKSKCKKLLLSLFLCKHIQKEETGIHKFKMCLWSGSVLEMVPIIVVSTPAVCNLSLSKITLVDTDEQMRRMCGVIHPLCLHPSFCSCSLSHSYTPSIQNTHSEQSVHSHSFTPILHTEMK